MCVDISVLRFSKNNIGKFVNGRTHENIFLNPEHDRVIKVEIYFNNFLLEYAVLQMDFADIFGGCTGA